MRAAKSHKKDASVPAEPLISIIDDDDSLRMALIGLVRSIGYTARGFASAEEFLAADALDSFACIVTDIQMPGMSGIDLKRHLAARQCQLPVIMITAHPDPGLEARAQASGAAGFLKKPFEGSALVDCLEKALKRRS